MVQCSLMARWQGQSDDVLRERTYGGRGNLRTVRKVYEFISLLTYLGRDERGHHV